MGSRNCKIQEPASKRPVENIEEFFRFSTDIAHFAIKRVGYFHHFIVIARRQIYEYNASVKFFFTGPGKVIYRDINEEEIQEALDNGKLYIIGAPNYPKSAQQIEEAINRTQARTGEQAYLVASNNCEHLARYIMTGTPYSDQCSQAGPGKKAAADSIDCIVCQGKRNSIKMGLNELSMISNGLFLKLGVDNFLSTTSTLIQGLPVDPCQVVDLFTNNFIDNVCKFSVHTKSEILASKACVDAAHCANIQVLVGTAGSAVLIAGIIETVMVVYGYKKLQKQRHAGGITERDFKREITKSIVGAIFATIGSAAGGCLGQVLIPVPFIGFGIGALVFNFVFRWLGSLFAGFIFDVCKKEKVQESC